MEGFISYLKAQIGQPYLWGGQHTLLTQENLCEILSRREKTAENADRVRRYCEQAFAKGHKTLYGYDCSGLGVYYLLKTGLLKKDTTAHGLMGLCVLKEQAPEKGWWVFKTDSSGRATHIGYMISHTRLIHAKGRDSGVVEEAYRREDWDRVGFPTLFPAPAEATPSPRVLLLGRVYVRKTPGGTPLYIGKKGDELPYLHEIAKDKDGWGWYKVESSHGVGYVSCFERKKKRYTRLIHV